MIQIILVGMSYDYSSTLFLLPLGTLGDERVYSYMQDYHLIYKNICLLMKVN